MIGIRRPVYTIEVSRCPSSGGGRFLVLNEDGMKGDDFVGAVVGEGGVTGADSGPNGARAVGFCRVGSRFCVISMPKCKCTRASGGRVRGFNVVVRRCLGGERGLGRMFLLISFERGPARSSILVCGFLGCCGLPMAVIAAGFSGIGHSLESGRGSLVGGALVPTLNSRVVGFSDIAGLNGREICSVVRGCFRG